MIINTAAFVQSWIEISRKLCKYVGGKGVDVKSEIGTGKLRPKIFLLE